MREICFWCLCFQEQKQTHHFAGKGPYSQSSGFSSCHVQMWELDQKEGWLPRIDASKLC